MSRNFVAMAVGLGVGVLTLIASPYIIVDVDKAWWVGAVPGANDIAGRAFIASAMGLGAWIVTLVYSIYLLEKKNRV